MRGARAGRSDRGDDLDAEHRRDRRDRRLAPTWSSGPRAEGRQPCSPAAVELEPDQLRAHLLLLNAGASICLGVRAVSPDGKPQDMRCAQLARLVERIVPRVRF